MARAVGGRPRRPSRSGSSVGSRRSAGASTRALPPIARAWRFPRRSVGWRGSPRVGEPGGPARPCRSRRGVPRGCDGGGGSPSTAGRRPYLRGRPPGLAVKALFDSGVGRRRLNVPTRASSSTPSARLWRCSTSSAPACTRTAGASMRPPATLRRPGHSWPRRAVDGPISWRCWPRRRNLRSPGGDRRRPRPDGRGRALARSDAARRSIRRLPGSPGSPAGRGGRCHGGGRRTCRRRARAAGGRASRRSLRVEGSMAGSAADPRVAAVIAICRAERGRFAGRDDRVHLGRVATRWSSVPRPHMSRPSAIPRGLRPPRRSPPAVRGANRAPGRVLDRRALGAEPLVRAIADIGRARPARPAGQANPGVAVEGKDDVARPSDSRRANPRSFGCSPSACRTRRSPIACSYPVRRPAFTYRTSSASSAWRTASRLRLSPGGSASSHETGPRVGVAPPDRRAAPSRATLTASLMAGPVRPAYRSREAGKEADRPCPGSSAERAAAPPPAASPFPRPPPGSRRAL